MAEKNSQITVHRSNAIKLRKLLGVADLQLSMYYTAAKRRLVVSKRGDLAPPDAFQALSHSPILHTSTIDKIDASLAVSVERKQALISDTCMRSTVSIRSARVSSSSCSSRKSWLALGTLAYSGKCSYSSATTIGPIRGPVLATDVCPTTPVRAGHFTPGLGDVPNKKMSANTVGTPRFLHH